MYFQESFIWVFYQIVIRLFYLTVVQSLGCVQFFATPRTTVQQASLSFSISQSLLKLVSIELVIHPTISFSATPFSSCAQSFPASGSLQMSQIFESGGQSTFFSSSISLSNEYSGLTSLRTDWLILLSKGLSRVFSSTTVQKYQFFNAQFSLRSNSHICIWLLETL